MRICLSFFLFVSYRNKNANSFLLILPLFFLNRTVLGLDPAWRRHLAQVLLKLPVQVLLIASHDLNWLGKVTQRALVLTDGKIQIDHPIQPLLADGKTLDNLGLPLGW
ncbi:ABC transporter-like protein [Raphidiopsis brookii D9]|nr:ABC transporter-like protein [Raphidiopsis brookii D9]